MIQGRSINFIDIVRLLLKDRDFIEYYLSDRYNISAYKNYDARILSIKPSPTEPGVSSFIVDPCDGNPPVIKHEFDGLYRIRNREIKLHIPSVIVYLRTYFPNYVSTGTNGKRSFTTFDMTAVFNNSVSRGHMKKHLNLMDVMDGKSSSTLAFLERFLMACRSEDETYTKNDPNKVLLFSYRKLRDLSQLKANGVFDEVYDRFKKFINEYHIVYIKNRRDDFDLTKEECMSILIGCKGFYPNVHDTEEELAKRPIKHEFSDIFDYSEFI
jgi:hypothetical protein